jgi:hypothetical protein
MADQLRNIYVRLGSLETQGAISANNYEHLKQEVAGMLVCIERMDRESRESRRRHETP